MFGSVTRQKIWRPLAPSTTAASSWLVPWLSISGISSRAERQRNEQRRKGDARHCEDDLDAVCRKPGAKEALQSEEQHVNEARHHRRHRERNVDQRQEKALAAELELGDRPRGGKAEGGVQRRADRGRENGEPDRSARFGLQQRGKIDARALAEGFDEDNDERQHQKKGEKHQRERDQGGADMGRLGQRQSHSRRGHRPELGGGRGLSHLAASASTPAGG